MKKSKNYVGIDITKLSFDIAIIDNKDTYKHYKFSNDHKGFELFTAVLNNKIDVCVMEASGSYYLQLATYLN